MAKITKKTSKEFALKSWRARRGIKLVCSIKPKGRSHLAVCEVEGKQYKATGPTNSDALDNLFEVLKSQVSWTL